MQNIKITISSDNQPNIVISTQRRNKKKKPYEKVKHLLKTTEVKGNEAYSRMQSLSRQYP